MFDIGDTDMVLAVDWTKNCENMSELPHSFRICGGWNLQRFWGSVAKELHHTFQFQLVLSLFSDEILGNIWLYKQA